MWINTTPMWITEPYDTHVDLCDTHVDQYDTHVDQYANQLPWDDHAES